MQTLVSVVIHSEPKMLTDSSSDRYEGGCVLRHGLNRLPAYREGLNHRVISTQQGKSVPLPRGGRDAARRIDGDADNRSETKRMSLCNGANIGCVHFKDNIIERVN